MKMISQYCNHRGFESFVTAEASPDLPFSRAVDSLLQRYDEILEANGVSPDSGVFLRFHVSDTVTQAEELGAALKPRFQDTMTAIVQQPPASGSKIALEAYHMGCREGRFEKLMNGESLVVHHGNYRSLWGSMVPGRNGTPYNQTNNILHNLSETIGRFEGTVKDNVVRTWFFVRDIDNNYKGMVDARREWFERSGMTKDTHYIASTGIEGCFRRPSCTVLLNYLAVLGLSPEQVEFMSALDHLCPTHDYGVTFERGTRIVYGDRSHFYISGTASIDSTGAVMHCGDVIKQAGRTIENMNALLENHGASLEDMKLVVVYLRDGSDYTMVERFLRDHLPAGAASVIVTAPVCRPEWLIEMDGVAITGTGDRRFETFC